MPAIEEKSDGHLKTVSFQESPVMSTYLVAVVVGEFEYIEQTTTAGNKVRVYCEVGKTNQGMFALDVAVRTLLYHAKYFGTPYPLPKLDMVAIPDFSDGAMENYGLVTYRETALLYDEKHSAAANKQRIAVVVAHELAHQWFGNLVTMEWWTDLWLKEGFATWVSYLAVDYLFPEWKIWTQFIDETVKAYRLDGLVESHPVESQYLSSGKLGNGHWVIPITLCYGSYNARKNALLREKLGSISLSGIADSQEDAGSQPSWIKLNVGQTAFYRVQYDDELAKRLRSAIGAGSLDATDRFGILDDTYALCSACKQPLSALLSLMDAYRNELDYSVLLCLIDIAYKVSSVVGDAIPQSAADFKSFTINLLQFAAEKLGWEPIPGESHLNAMLRGQILVVLAQFGHEETKVEARRRFNVFLNDRSTTILPADIRKAAYIAVMQNVTTSTKSGYESLLRIFRETDLSQEKERILGSIASSPDPSVVREALDFSLSSEEKWDFIWKNWGSGSLVTRFVNSVVSTFSSEEKADEIKEFFSTRMQPSIERTVNQSIEQVRISAQWVKHVQQQDGLVELLQELAV